MTNYLTSFQCEWIVGLTDGDGTFAIDKTKSKNDNLKYNLVYKVTLKKVNIRALLFLKSLLPCGNLNGDKSMIQFRIRNRQLLKKYIFPIFQKYSLLTKKQFDFEKIIKAFNILESPLPRKQINLQIEALPIMKPSKDFINSLYFSYPPSQLNPVLLPNITPPNKDLMQTKWMEHFANKYITKGWLSGFIEAEGSFFITSNINKLVHSFGITQKDDKLLLKGIRAKLSIVAKVQKCRPLQSKSGFFKLQTKNTKTIQFMCTFFHNQLKGVKNLDFKIWARSYTNYKGNFEKLKKVRDLLRKMRL